MVLFRRLLGDVLREQRMRRGMTLREVSAEARVSLGYISEIERGQKEASSELLYSLCAALDLPLSDVLREVSDAVALEERTLEPTPITVTRAVATSSPPPPEHPPARPATGRRASATRDGSAVPTRQHATGRPQGAGWQLGTSTTPARGRRGPTIATRIGVPQRRQGLLSRR